MKERRERGGKSLREEERGGVGVKERRGLLGGVVSSREKERHG